jgi:hypothetical protein
VGGATPKTFYPLYVGKEKSRAAGLVRQMVETLVEPFARSNRNVTCDSFTDFDMTQSLLSNDLTIDTAHKNQTFIPPEFLPRKNHP